MAKNIKIKHHNAPQAPSSLSNSLSKPIEDLQHLLLPLIIILLLLIGLSVSVYLAQKPQDTRNFATALTTTTAKPIVGAIRWDWWSYTLPGHDDDDLAPQMWHYRLPFYAKEISSTQIDLQEDSQSVIDQEILYASDAGLKYWLFDWYNFSWQDSSPQYKVNYGLNYYLTSSFKTKINFSLMFMGNTAMDLPSLWETKTVPKFVNLVKQPTYQKVLTNRPLVFVFAADTLIPFFNCGSTAANPVCADTSTQKTLQELNYLRQQVQLAGLGNPYLVAMTWNPSGEATLIQNMGFDSVSAYSAQLITNETATFDNGLPYTDLIKSNTRFRNNAVNAGLKVIPVVNTGWDRRPGWPDPEPHHIWYLQGTPLEIATNLQNAINFNISNPTANPTGAVLLYAWNEYVEGGWLGPTLYEGNVRLNAITSILNPQLITPTPTGPSNITLSPSLNPTGSLSPTLPSSITSPTPAPTAVTIDDPKLTFTGQTWNSYNNTCAYGGSWHMSSTAGDSANYSFTGSQVSILPVKQLNRGIAKVYIDGKLVGAIDEYSSSLICQTWFAPFSAGTYGNHNLKIVVSGTKNSASSGYNVAIDAIQYK